MPAQRVLMGTKNARNVPAKGDQIRHPLPGKEPVRIAPTLSLAETVRFELTEELPPRQFSRLLP